MRHSRFMLHVCTLALALGVLTLATSGWAANIIIDHTNWDWYVTQPQSVSDSVAAQTLFFAHASVGANVMSGFADLHGTDATKYPLAQTSANGTPPASTVPGTVYEYNRGNPVWSTKVTDFTTYIQNGWRTPKATFAMNKFCYIDQTADWTVYRDAMLALEAAYPATRFIYWTMPCTTASDADEALRAQFNTNLRNWIATQDGKLLFDIADIESWSPAGVHQTFIYNTATYEHMYSPYSSDGGHLNQTGYDRMATGLYSLLGQATLPLVTGSPTATATTTLTFTSTPTRTSTPTATPSPTLTRTATVTPTGTLTATPTPTSSATSSATLTPVLSATPTLTTTLTGTTTAVLTSTPTYTATDVSTVTPTCTPTPALRNTSGDTIRAYPNPARGQVRFDLPTSPAAAIELKVFNVQGERVGTKRLTAGDGTSTTVLWDCTALAPGVYFAHIEVAGEKTQTIKFAVRH